MNNIIQHLKGDRVNFYIWEQSRAEKD